MPMKILILEDDARRRQSMSDCLVDRFPQYEIVFARTATEMNRLVQRHLVDACLIALDHDLELIESADGRLIDSGTGRDVADGLALRTPACPIVIHSTNSPAAVGMQMVLEEAGWDVHRVLPFNDLEWIPTIWFRTVRDAVVSSADAP